jgi:hypothetical protein
MGMGRAQEIGMELARKVDVADVLPAAGQESTIFDPSHGLPDAELPHTCLSLLW